MKKCVALLRNPFSELLLHDDGPQVSDSRISQDLTTAANVAIFILYGALAQLAPDYIWKGGVEFDLGNEWSGGREDGFPNRIPLTISVPRLTSEKPEDPLDEIFEEACSLQIARFLSQVELWVIAPLATIEAVEI